MNNSHKILSKSILREYPPVIGVLQIGLKMYFSALQVALG